MKWRKENSRRIDKRCKFTLNGSPKIETNEKKEEISLSDQGVDR